MDAVGGSHIDVASGVHFDAVRDAQARAVVACNGREQVSVGQSAALVDHMEYGDVVRPLDVQGPGAVCTSWWTCASFTH